jgi:RNA polymerase sigma factor (sigma-70 family)
MKGSPFYTDQDFLNGIRGSDHLIEKAFYDQNYNMIRGLIKNIDGSKNIDVDDLYQEVMVVVFMRIKNHELMHLTAKLSTYVYKIAHNLLLYRLRSNSRMKTSPLEDHDFAEETQSDVSIDTLEIIALEMVKKLTYPCNEILEDWYIHKLDYEQIALKYRYKNANTAKKKKGDCMANARIQAKELLKNKLSR